MPHDHASNFIIRRVEHWTTRTTGSNRRSHLISDGPMPPSTHRLCAVLRKNSNRDTIIKVFAEKISDVIQSGADQRRNHGVKLNVAKIFCRGVNEKKCHIQSRIRGDDCAGEIRVAYPMIVVSDHRPHFDFGSAFDDVVRRPNKRAVTPEDRDARALPAVRRNEENSRALRGFIAIASAAHRGKRISAALKDRHAAPNDDEDRQERGCPPY